MRVEMRDRCPMERPLQDWGKPLAQLASMPWSTAILTGLLSTGAEAGVVSAMHARFTSTNVTCSLVCNVYASVEVYFEVKGRQEDQESEERNAADR
jgi:hypothetical protein